MPDRRRSVAAARVAALLRHAMPLSSPELQDTEAALRPFAAPKPRSPSRHAVPPGLWDIHDCAAHLRMGVAQIRRLIKAGQFVPAISFGPRTRRWQPAEVLSWVQHRREAPGVTRPSDTRQLTAEQATEQSNALASQPPPKVTRTKYH